MTGSRRSRGRCWRSRRPNRGTGGGDGGMDVGQSSTRSRPRRGDLLASLNSESSARATTGGDAGGRGRTRACDISTSTVESATSACVGVSPDAAAVSSTSTEHDAPRCGAGMRGIGWCSGSRRAARNRSPPRAKRRRGRLVVSRVGAEGATRGPLPPSRISDPASFGGGARWTSLRLDEPPLGWCASVSTAWR